MRWKDRILISHDKQASLINQIDPDRASLISENREYLKFLFKFQMYFTKNELPYRGHDETEDSLSPGKWKDLINLQMDTNQTFKS